MTGQNSLYGLFRGEIRGCTIDGNKANQTAASYGIRLYGHGLEMTDVSVRNAYSDGIYTEWGLDSTFATPFLDLEGYFTGIRSAFNNGNGWTFRGPHDSDFVRNGAIPERRLGNAGSDFQHLQRQRPFFQYQYLPEYTRAAYIAIARSMAARSWRPRLQVGEC